MKISLAVAFAAATATVAAGDELDSGRDDNAWSYTPDRMADWYQAHDQPLPELAPELTVIEASKSYVVNLECLGCPFRVRKLGEFEETWQEPAQENSLLLNFTIDEASQTLLLNNWIVLPVESRPPPLTAFQIPANTSAETMGKIVGMHMLDPSWVLGTKYGQFELQYAYAQLATQTPTEHWLHFDITAIHMRDLHNRDSYRLDKKGQKMVQLKLAREVVGENQLSYSIKDVHVIERLSKDRAKPLKMKCGKDAMLKVEYNPLEWDFYGKFGTYTRQWHQFTWDTMQFFKVNGLVIICISILLGALSIVRWSIKRSQAGAVAHVKDDAEAALLAPEYEDAPPEYEDVQKEAVTKEESQ